MAKKLILVIVEGPSDKAALDIIFTRFVNPKDAETIVTHGDITSDKDTIESNVVARVCQYIKDFKKERKLKKDDILRVIHIVDTDGTFISDDRIVYDKAATDFVYSDTEIRSDNIARVISRNEQKRKNIEKLLSTHFMWVDIPYCVYYMSCNLDHALYNKRGSDDLTKERDAHAFAKKYKDDIPGFVKFIAESDFSVIGDYKESWRYIKQGENSLQRHTNLGLFFTEEPNDE